MEGDTFLTAAFLSPTLRPVSLVGSILLDESPWYIVIIFNKYVHLQQQKQLIGIYENIQEHVTIKKSLY
jgi:hypothetical protein